MSQPHVTTVISLAHTSTALLIVAVLVVSYLVLAYLALPWAKLRRFWRAAVVTHQHWVRWVARAENALFPVEIRVFPLAAKKEATAWVSERAPE